MITNYDIDRKLYRLIKEAVANGTIPITGGVWNGDRPLNSDGEDITVRTMSVNGDGYEQTTTMNVNVYVPDIAEDHGGFVRNGRRLSELANAVTDFIENIIIVNVNVLMEAMTEMAEKDIRQHYINFRVRIDVYADMD